jgi:hypothetical protein
LLAVKSDEKDALVPVITPIVLAPSIVVPAVLVRPALAVNKPLKVPDVDVRELVVVLPDVEVRPPLPIVTNPPPLAMLTPNADKLFINKLFPTLLITLVVVRDITYY